MSEAFDEAVDGVQQALATEHEAVYAYGVSGGVIDPASGEAVQARDAYDEHRARRDLLETIVRDLGADPVVASPGYALPEPVTDGAAAARLARRVEDRCAATYAELVAVSTGPLRRDAIGWLGDAATRGLSWGAAPTAFPGLRGGGSDQSR